ncbi:hypothetical protein AG0111_0g12860 [Alternaria gaisen]|uniref:Uncharacterized protein n=1 Tax=Alternaria gaisen TaxID=167740 RepID=A0ACB6F352_9PLEO|nr:hypothetical protein AG0111_0g12860 [Alternaria gaisen]
MSAPSDHKLSSQDSSPQLDYIEGSSNQVLSFQNANSRRFTVNDEQGHASGTEWEWWSRENRKGRHILLLTHAQAPSRTARTAPYASFGADPSIISGVISFVRGMLFLLGGKLLLVEAVNANQSDCFGWALKGALNSDGENVDRASADEEKGTNSSDFQPDLRKCTHIHNPDRMKHQIMHTKTFRVEARPESGPEQTWKWWPTWQDVRVHYRREIGFNANLILFVGTANYWVTNLLTLPGIYDTLPQGVLYGLYYPSSLLGAICFFVASILYIFEVQRQWWKPAPKMIGWWVGMTNLVGSVGWRLHKYNYLLPGNKMTLPVTGKSGKDTLASRLEDEFEKRPDPVALTHNADESQNNSSGVDYEPHPENSIKLNSEREKIVQSICNLYSGSASEDDMMVYGKEAVYDDPWSYCDTRYKIAGQWYGIPKLMKSSRTIKTEVLSSKPDEIIFKLQQEYTPKPMPISKKVNSLITLTLDQDGKVRYHKDMWNEKDYSHEGLGKIMKELNGDHLTKITKPPAEL